MPQLFFKNNGGNWSSEIADAAEDAYFEMHPDEDRPRRGKKRRRGGQGDTAQRHVRRAVDVAVADEARVGTVDVAGAEQVAVPDPDDPFGLDAFFARCRAAVGR